MIETYKEIATWKYSALKKNALSFQKLNCRPYDKYFCHSQAPQGKDKKKNFEHKRGG